MQRHEMTPAEQRAFDCLLATVEAWKDAVIEAQRCELSQSRYLGLYDDSRAGKAKQRERNLRDAMRGLMRWYDALSGRPWPMPTTPNILKGES
jgi:hypothetical protein